MKKFAHIIWGAGYDTERDHCTFQNKNQITSIFTVNSFDEALNKIQTLLAEGYGAFELCGAFGEENAAKLREAIQGQAPIGYVYYQPEDQKKATAFFRG